MSILLCVLILLIVSCDKWDSVRTTVKDAIADKAFPGAVVGVLYNNEVVFKEAFGTYYYGSDIPMTVDTLFDLASVSKVIGTTSAVMLLYDQKAWTLEEKISKYVPDFKANGKENITILNCMVHESGMQPDSPFDDFSDMNAQMLFQYTNNLRLQYKTGTEFSYSDFSMIAMKEVIEVFTSMKL